MTAGRDVQSSRNALLHQIQLLAGLKQGDAGPQTAEGNEVHDTGTDLPLPFLQPERLEQLNWRRGVRTGKWPHQPAQARQIETARQDADDGIKFAIESQLTPDGPR